MELTTTCPSCGEPVNVLLPWHPQWALHPGETLREVLADRGITQTEFAAATGYTQKHISRIMTEHAAVTAQSAVRFERALGIPADFWMNLQSRYDVAVARVDVAVGAIVD